MSPPPVKVAYVGNFRHRFCTEVHVASALESLGCKVYRVQEDNTPLLDLEKVSAQCALFLYTRTWGFADPEGAIRMLRRLEAKGVVTASFHLDLYLGLRRQATLDGDPFWATQWVFTPDGDPESEAEFARRSIRHVWSPPGVHGPECRAGVYEPKFAHDVVFVGSYPYPHAEWPYRNELVEWLTSTYAGRFRRYGGGATLVRNEPLNNLYASAGVVVGDSLCPGFAKPRYWSDRLVETTGRGGALVWPWIEGVEDEGFRDGEHLRFYPFGDFVALRRVIDEMLTDPVETKKMALRAQQFVASRHTYKHRLARLLHVVGLRDRETL